MSPTVSVLSRPDIKFPAQPQAWRGPSASREAIAEYLSTFRGVRCDSSQILVTTGSQQALQISAQVLLDAKDQVKVYWLPAINAAIDPDQGNSSEALKDLEVARPYELGGGATFISYIYPAYLRGQAHLLGHNPDAAAVEFQKLLEHRGIVLNFVTGTLAHLQLARAYAMAGDTAKAKMAYQDFFALWKDADYEIPVLNQARAEYAKLR